MTAIRRRTPGLGVGLLGLSTLYWVPAQAQQFTLTDLGTLGGPYSQAYSINNAGQVVGAADTASGAQ